MNKKVVFLAIVISVIIIAVLAVFLVFMGNVEEEPTAIEYIGGKYNATIYLWNGRYGQIDYTDEQGSHSDMYFHPGMRDCLDWIKANTSEDAIFLCWWDYGHMVKGYAERDVVVRNPSEQILYTIMDPSGTIEFDPHDKIVEVARAFTTTNETETIEVMRKYNASYIVVCTDDLQKCWWFFNVSGKDPEDYFVTREEFNNVGKQTVIAHLLENRPLIHMSLVKEFDKAKIYKLDTTIYETP